MEAQVSEILENILSLLLLEGSFEVNEKEDGVFVTIDTQEAGKLIGHQGETLTALQLLVNQIVFKQLSKTDEKKTKKESAEPVQPKRVIIDVSDWRRGKEEELAHRARSWAQEVNESGQEMELDPMPAWQRRIIHMTIEGTDGVTSESVGEGLDRHLIIRPSTSSKEGLKEKTEDVVKEA